MKTRQKNPVIFAICEGDGESAYLRRFSRRDKRVLPFVSPHKRPDLLVQYAADLIESHQIDLDSNDSIWCVFDRDNNSNQDLHEADVLANRYHFLIAYSNPCFEIWLYWHFQDSMRHWRDSYALKEAMRTLIAEYHETGDYNDLLFPLLELASHRAKVARNTHIRNEVPMHSRESEPVTEIDLILQEIMLGNNTR